MKCSTARSGWLVGAALAAALAANAGPRDPLYQWTDANGAVRYTSEIERIRARYREVTPEATRYSRPLLHVDGHGGGGIRHLASHSATMVLIVVSLMAGGVAALAMRAATTGLVIAASAGATATVITATAFLFHQALTWQRATRAILVEDPVPATSSAGDDSRSERFASRHPSRVRHI